MATAVSQPETTRLQKSTSNLPGRRYDHFFFSAVALLMLATVYVGFAPTYYAAGIFSAPLPSRIIHVHAVAFSLWILLLITQTSLVASGRVDIHRRLGIAGFLLACSMVVLGVLAATDTLARNMPVGRDPKSFYITPLTNIVIFTVLIYFAFRSRFDPAAHKRLIILATNALLMAAIARWHWAVVYRRSIVAGRVSYVFLLAVIAYDLWSLRKVHRATIWGGTLMVCLQNIAPVIGQTEGWRNFAAWIQTIVR